MCQQSKNIIVSIRKSRNPLYNYLIRYLENAIGPEQIIKLKLKYKPQKCSYCKGLILHPDDQKEKPIKSECLCASRGEYYEKSNIESEHSGTSPRDDSNGYAFTKEDQDHHY